MCNTTKFTFCPLLHGAKGLHSPAQHMAFDRAELCTGAQGIGFRMSVSRDRRHGYSISARLLAGPLRCVFGCATGYCTPTHRIVIFLLSNLLLKTVRRVCVCGGGVRVFGSQGCSDCALGFTLQGMPICSRCSRQIPAPITAGSRKAYTTFLQALSLWSGMLHMHVCWTLQGFSEYPPSMYLRSTTCNWHTPQFIYAI